MNLVPLFCNHQKIRHMKNQSLLLILGLLLSLPFVSLGQTEINDSISLKCSSANVGPKKGEFHIGLTDFASLEDGTSKIRIMPRFGYMVSDNDMIFIDFTYQIQRNMDYEGFNLESSLNYRRYLLKGAFRPFFQFGLGAGFRAYEETRSNMITNDYYMKVGTGAGVSYRYKKWSFEAGMQMNYNEYGTGRVQFKPLVGVSFSF